MVQQLQCSASFLQRPQQPSGRKQRLQGWGHPLVTPDDGWGSQQGSLVGADFPAQSLQLQPSACMCSSTVRVSLMHMAVVIILPSLLCPCVSSNPHTIMPSELIHLHQLKAIGNTPGRFKSRLLFLRAWSSPYSPWEHNTQWLWGC